MRSIVALAVALLLLNGGPVQAKPPVWIVRDADSELVLFGSIHVLPPNLDWRPAALDHALQVADDLWLELPIDPQTEARSAQLAGAQGVMAADKSLFALLSPKGRDRLQKACLRFHLAPGLVDRLAPWYAEVVLASVEYQQAGAAVGAGVEQSVAKLTPAGARREALETPEFQIGLFAQAPVAEQVASLEESLQEMETAPKAFNRLLAAWMAGDLGTLEKDALGPLRKASPLLYARLVTERNAAWAAILDGRLKGHGHTVVVVGMGHLIGPGGVPARLRALGYSVEGP